MAEEKDASEKEASEKAGEARPDPEKGPTRSPSGERSRGRRAAKKGAVNGAMLLRDIALEALRKNLQAIVDCVLDNIKVGKHLPSVKLLFELATHLTPEDEIPEEDLLSFAEVLWQDFEEFGGITLEGEVVSVSEEPRTGEQGLAADKQG